MNAASAIEATLVGRHLVSLDSDAAWVEKYKPLQSSTHLIEYEKDPASIVVNTSTFFPGVRQGVIFIDHAPGETRHVALDRARTLADYVVIHDAEDYGYGLERVFKTYKHVRKFRYMRPWTAVCSDARPIFSSPYPEDGP